MRQVAHFLASKEFADCICEAAAGGLDADRLNFIVSFLPQYIRQNETEGEGRTDPQPFGQPLLVMVVKVTVILLRSEGCNHQYEEISHY